MSWDEDLPPIPTERLREGVLAAGRATRRRRRQLMAGGAGALALLLIVTLIAVLPGDDPGPSTVVAGPPDRAARDSSNDADADDSTETTESTMTTTAAAAQPATTRPPAKYDPATSTTLGPRQGEGAGTCVKALTGRDRVLLHRNTQNPPINHLYSINPDGTCLQQHTFGDKHVLNFGASWSPDRTQIAFIRKDAGVMVMDVDGANERLLLAETKVQPSGAWTDWSPDGKKIVAARQEGIWVIDVATGDAFHLVNDQNSNSPSWSPGGDRIVYAVWVSPGVFDIVVVKPDGSGRTRIGTGSAPNWGPDGRIAFSPSSDGIAVMNADGTNPVKISSDTTLGRPVWSLNGKRIVASSGPGDTFVMNADGGGRRSLTSGNSDTATDW